MDDTGRGLEPEPEAPLPPPPELTEAEAFLNKLRACNEHFEARRAYVSYQIACLKRGRADESVPPPLPHDSDYWQSIFRDDACELLTKANQSSTLMAQVNKYQAKLKAGRQKLGQHEEKWARLCRQREGLSSPPPPPPWLSDEFWPSGAQAANLGLPPPPAPPPPPPPSLLPVLPPFINKLKDVSLAKLTWPALLPFVNFVTDNPSPTVTTPAAQLPTVSQCAVCHKEYNNRRALWIHMQTHAVRWKCQVPGCAKTFSRKWLLEGHVRRHTGEKPYQCHQCSKSFADRSNLRQHIQALHSPDKPYSCQFCGQKYAVKSYLVKHVCQKLVESVNSYRGLNDDEEDLFRQ